MGEHYVWCGLDGFPDSDNLRTPLIDRNDKIESDNRLVFLFISPNIKPYSLLPDQSDQS